MNSLNSLGLAETGIDIMLMASSNINKPRTLELWLAALKRRVCLALKSTLKLMALNLLTRSCCKALLSVYKLRIPNSLSDIIQMVLLQRKVLVLVPAPISEASHTTLEQEWLNGKV